MMAKAPRKSTCGFKYESEAHNGVFYVQGPSINNLVRCDDKADAEMIAAALNFCTNFDTIKREAQKLADNIEYLRDFK